jgi:hypothetical protein
MPLERDEEQPSKWDNAAQYLVFGVACFGYLYAYQRHTFGAWWHWAIAGAGLLAVVFGLFEVLRVWRNWDDEKVGRLTNAGCMGLLVIGGLAYFLSNWAKISGWYSSLSNMPSWASLILFLQVLILARLYNRS